MKKLCLLYVLISQAYFVSAANPIIFQEEINWFDEPVSLQTTKTTTIDIISFEDAIYNPTHKTLPIYNKEFKLDNYGELDVRISNEVYESFVRTSNEDDIFISNTININSRVEIGRRQSFAVINFIPIRKNDLTGNYERLVSFELKVTLREKALPLNPISNRNQNSVLADGDIYKMAVSATGVYKLTYDFLKNDLKIANIDNIDPRTIKIYGDAGGILPQPNAEFRYDDVPENAIFVSGEADGQFNSGDYILFYGENPDGWLHSDNYKITFRQENPYTNHNHYFIKISAGNGKRIQDQTSLSNTAYNTSTYDFQAHYETDLINLLDKDLYRHGSGKVWFGESFKFTRSQSFDFNIPNIANSTPARTLVYVASRDVVGSNSFKINYNGTNIKTINLSATSSNVEHLVAKPAIDTFEIVNPSSSIALTLDYQASPNAEGYLNFISINARRNLVFFNGQMAFRDRKTLDFPSAKFSLSNATGVTVWDVTNTTEVKKQLGNTSGGTFDFGLTTSELKEFIAFDGSSFLSAEPIGKIENQNLHDLETPEMVIIYHPTFKDAADRLTAHRRSYSNITVEAVNVNDIFNEFGSGSADVTAIRDFVKYLYDNGNLKYLLLFGDASFDFRNISNKANPQQFIPTYETSQSLDPITAFPMDDYYGLLDITEGNSPSNFGTLDIGIGRFPVKTNSEANHVVDKLIDYETNPDNYGDWKNRITFMADDEDSNQHAKDANLIADRVRAGYPVYNVDKIFIDAYRQEVLPAGERYPDAENAIYANVFKGNLVMCYLGHGDSDGLTQERVIDVDKIRTWNNHKNLPLFVTATCSFGPYDDHGEVSIGEELFLKNNGGSIALFTTTRLVYAGSNKALTQSVFDNIFEQIGNDIPPLGEVLRMAKNSCIGCTENSRKFTLFGDPSMSLKYPKHQVITTSINSNPATQKDTIQALQEVTITGEIHDENGNFLSDYNGTIYSTVFDKIKTKTGLGNDPRSRPVFSFDVQNNILFRGRASVTNGKFSFNFIVPKDIDYQYGFGKISYYADNGDDQEAWGYHDTIYIGGTYQNAIVDNEGPNVEVFMNNENFVFGGLTDENPVIYVKLSDDNGINTSSTGIGHGISAILDENTQQSYSLNDFYESKLNDYKSGTAKYPLSEMTEGRHQVTVKAWDVSNNSGTGYTEFVVASTAEAALEHVLNYPNPFTTSTEFQFEHNLPNQPLQVQISIFTVSGKLVKTIQEEVIADGYRVTGIKWDGLDDFGNPIGRGVYVYKVSIGLLSETNQVSTSTSEFQKLVILK